MHPLQKGACNRHVCMIKEKTKLMLLTLACCRVLGHKVPRLRHLYKPIKSKINQYLNNSPKKFNTNYSKNYMILLKLQQITSNNRLERFIYIPSGGDIIMKHPNFLTWNLLLQCHFDLALIIMIIMVILSYLYYDTS